jgi:hypothetical protein
MNKKVRELLDLAVEDSKKVGQTLSPSAHVAADGYPERMCLGLNVTYRAIVEAEGREAADAWVREVCTQATARGKEQIQKKFVELKLGSKKLIGYILRVNDFAFTKGQQLVAADVYSKLGIA